MLQLFIFDNFQSEHPVEVHSSFEEALSNFEPNSHEKKTILLMNYKKRPAMKVARLMQRAKSQLGYKYRGDHIG